MNKVVLFIITSVHQGGLETYLLRFLVHEKNQITAIVLYKNIDYDKEFYNKFISAGAKMIRLPLTFSPTSMYKLYVLLKKDNVVTVCDFRGDFSGIALAISWLSGIENRIVFYRESVHQFQSSFIKNCYIKIINFLTNKFSTKILSNSQQAFNNFFNSKSLKNKYHKVIRNGVYKENDFLKYSDIRSQYGIPIDAFVIGHVGRYTLAKNHELIIEVANILCHNDKKIYFLLCGKDVACSLIGKLDEYNLHDRVITPGLCADIPSHLNVMNVFLFPSHNEGQPNALIEAMNEGVPIVASNIPSIKETVSMEMNKVLFAPSSVLDFVTQIESIKSGQSYYNIEDVKNWSRDAYSQVNRFEEFYKELL